MYSLQVSLKSLNLVGSIRLTYWENPELNELVINYAFSKIIRQQGSQQYKFG